MNLDAITADTLHRHLPALALWWPDPPEPSPALCPGCWAPLSLDPRGPDDLDRFVGACRALQCGEVVTYRVCEGRFIVAQRQRR
jgi:hypothetical protein